ncbi:MAG: hypothetical protein OXR66_08920 [Candidatus Woesearchaeota archaeon]|nr:hypothetical protein [Candidatus Woesearchaeota archaeon]
MQKLAARIFAAIALVRGLVGIVLGSYASIVHIVLSACFFLAARSQRPRGWNRLFGYIYLCVAVIGFAMDLGTRLDNLLSLALGVAGIYVGRGEEQRKFRYRPWFFRNKVLG